MKLKRKTDYGTRPDPELEKARGRIGLTAEKNVEWLLRFADLKIDDLSEGDLLNLQYEAWEYGRRLGGADRFLTFLPNPDSPAMGSFGLLPSVQQLQSHQDFVQQFLEGILQAGWHRFKLPAIEVSFFAGDNRQEPGEVYMVSDDYQGPFKLAVALALQPLTHRIRRCPECDKRFLADRTNQDYDSPGCQSRAGMRRYRQSKGLVTGRRRGRPRKEGKKGPTS